MQPTLFENPSDDSDSERPQTRVVSRALIEGFWGSKTVDISFDTDANFLIGPNGCGKTTIVNLLAACLLADFKTIDRIEFSKVTVWLSNPLNAEDGASIEVSKTPEKNLPFPAISYRIEDAREPQALEVSLDDVEEQLAIRDMRYLMRRRAARANSSLIDKLTQLCHVTWLSVHRSEIGSREREREESYDSLVDVKIEQQANSFVRYFSRLDQKTAESLKEFQQTLFLSLLVSGDDNQWIADFKNYDLDKEKDALLAIFEQFALQKSKFVAKVDSHFSEVQEAARTFERDDGIGLSAISALISQRKIHEIVSEWNKFQETKRSVYRIRAAFVARVNSMLIGKEIYISKANEVAIRTKDGKGLSIKALSSGEKQLLIILGEALLQEGQPVVYIADEPELSLHVGWQEQLVSNIREINTNAQIIFATHSPDIVSSYANKVIDTVRVVG